MLCLCYVICCYLRYYENIMKIYKSAYFFLWFHLPQYWGHAYWYHLYMINFFLIYISLRCCTILITVSQLDSSRFLVSFIVLEPCRSSPALIPDAPCDLGSKPHPRSCIAKGMMCNIIGITLPHFTILFFI